MSPFLCCLMMALLLPCLLGKPLNSASTNGVNERFVKLYSRHTHRHLRMIGSKIDAEGNGSDEHAQLILQTINIQAHLRIKSAKEKTYLCVNENGTQLVVEDTPTSRCAFAEVYHKAFWAFKSVYNNSWYIGFKKNSQVKPPLRTSAEQKAAWFLIR